jgi:hypothetical protein
MPSPFLEIGKFFRRCFSGLLGSYVVDIQCAFDRAKIKSPETGSCGGFLTGQKLTEQSFPDRQKRQGRREESSLSLVIRGNVCTRFKLPSENLKRPSRIKVLS